MQSVMQNGRDNRTYAAVSPILLGAPAAHMMGVPLPA